MHTFRKIHFWKLVCVKYAIIFAEGEDNHRLEIFLHHEINDFRAVGLVSLRPTLLSTHCCIWFSVTCSFTNSLQSKIEIGFFKFTLWIQVKKLLRKCTNFCIHLNFCFTCYLYKAILNVISSLRTNANWIQKYSTHFWSMDKCDQY